MGQESRESVSSYGAEPDLSLLQEEHEEEEKEELVGREKHFDLRLYTQEMTLNRISAELFVSNLMQIQTY